MKPPASFYKIILPSVMQDHKLMIPREFTKVHGDKLSTTAKLTVPGGLSWDIGLEKSGKKLWFHDGWKEFAEHHAIQCWFFILFKYEGNSKFNALIFDLTASLIPKSVSDKGNGEGDDSVEILSSLGDKSPVLSSPQKVSYECVAKKATGERCNPSFLQNMSKFAPEFSMRIKTRGSHFSSMERLRSGLDFFTRNKRRKLDDGEEIIISEDLTATFQGSKQRACKIGNPERILLDKFAKKKDELQTTLKDKEVENAASKFVKSHRVTTFKPENASFTVVLQPYHIRYGPVHLPLLFIKRYLKISSDTNITLTIGGKQWKVLLVYSEGSHCLSRGWVTFVKENQLSVGNTCVFELIEAKNITLKVSISQGGEKLVKKRPEFAPESSMRLETHGSLFSSMETLRSGLGYFTRNKRRKLDDGEEITKFENLTESRQRACERPGLERFIRVDPQRKKSDDRKNGQNFPEGTQETRRSAISKNCLESTTQKEDGKQPINEAVDLKPGNPSFTVVLRPYNVKKSRLVGVSALFIRKYLNLSSGATILLTFGGRQWKVVLINSHHSHFLSGGWATFVSDNQLSVGDTCVFELVEVQKNITFQVSISRGGYKQKDLDKLPSEGTQKSGNFKSCFNNPEERAATEEVEQQPIPVKKEQEVEVLNTQVMKSQLMATIPERSKAKAINEAMMLKPENPYFMVFLKPHNVYPKYLMNVPAGFIEKYLNISSTTTILLLTIGGRQWEVVLFHDKISHCLRRGWSTFIDENHLSEGDICVFELIQAKNIIIFKVCIFRAGEGSAGGVKDEFG